MGKSNQRTYYFEKYIKNQPTAQAYLNALRSSPYKTHQRMAVALLPQLEALVKQHSQGENRDPNTEENMAGSNPD